MDMERIAIVGAGNVGRALGGTLAAAGHDVRFAVRSLEDRDHAASQIRAVRLGEAGGWCDIAFLCVPAGAAVAATRELGARPGTIVVDCTNPLRWQDGPVHTPPAGGSMAAALAEAFPALRVVKAFNTFGVEIHERPIAGGAAADVMIAGDDEEAKQTVARIADTSGFRGIDAGPLRNAGLLEAVAVLWIHLATKGGRGRHFAFRLVDQPVDAVS